MARNQQKWSEYMREYRSRPHTKGPKRDIHLQKTYGITLAQYDEMLSSQEDGCAICGTSAEDNGRRLDVDHCHTSGKVRGLLCRNCNTGIGKFKDSPDLLAEAMKYLYRNS